MASPYKPLSAAHQKIYEAYIAAVPGLTSRQLIELRSNIRLGKTSAKDFGGKLRINDEIFKNEYKNFQKLKKNLGTDKEFTEHLNKNYKPKRGKVFTADGVQNKRMVLNIKSPIPASHSPAVMTRFNAITDYATKLVNKANTGEKFVMIDNAGTYYAADDIKSKVIDKFKLKNYKNLKKEYYPILNKLHTRPEKIDLVLRNMLSEDTPLKQNWVDEVVKRTGISRTGVGDNLNKSKEYNKIKDKGADYIKRIGGKKLPSEFYTMSFSEQLPYALEVQSGHARYIGMGGETRYGSRPQNKIMQFAMRSWNQLKGSKDGPIQFFKKRSNTPITWKHGLTLPFSDVSFSYDGKKHTFQDLRSPNYMKNYFPEIYEKQNALNRLRIKRVDNPFKKGTMTVRELINEIQKKGYKWKPAHGPLDLLHGKKGVAYRPFTDLTYSSKDINQLEAGVGSALKAKKISRPQANQALKIIRSDIKGLTGPELDTAIINRQMNLAKRVKAGTLGGYADLSNAVRTLFNKSSSPRIQHKVAVALGCVGAAEGGRIGYALGSAAINCVNTKLTNDPVQSSLKLRATEGIGKIRGAATTFLGMLGRGGVKAAPYAAIGALGVAAEPLVKKFYIDDPTTYLTDENQQKGFLLSMIEAETPKVDQEILNWQYPGMAAATAAGAIPGAGAVYKARRGIAPSRDFIGPMHKGVGKTRAALGLSGVLGKALGASFSPLAAAATTPFHIASQRKAGTDWADIAASPGNWMGPAFMGGGYKMAAAGIKNPTLLKALRLGMSPRALMLGSRFGLAGLLGTAGLAGYDMYKNLRKKEPLKAVRYPDEQ